MELSIINRVAQLVTNSRIEASAGLKKEAPKADARDSVFISDLGSEVKRVKEQVNTLAVDPERQARINSLRKAVELKQYELSKEVVDSIAEKIANTLI